MKTTMIKLTMALALSIGVGYAAAANGQEDAGAEQGKTTLKLKKSAAESTAKTNAAGPSNSNGKSTRVRIKLPGKNGKIVTPGANQRLSTGSKASSVLPRMQRTPSGTIKPGALAEMQAEKKRADSPNKAANRKFQLKPNQKSSSSAASKGPKASAGQKAANRKFQLKPSTQSSASLSRSNSNLNKRNAGRFQSPKSLAGQATTRRPSSALNKQRVPATTRRMGGTFQSPKTLGSTASPNRPSATARKTVKSKAPKSKFKMGGKTNKALGRMAVGSTLVGAASQMKDAKKLRDSGQISKSQYRKMQASNGLKTAESITKIKKFNPATAVMNDVIGTDPISLGFEAAGDLLNGTNNAKQSMKNMGKAWDKSLTKQAFTDPKAAGKRVGQGLEKTGRNIERGAKKAGKKIEQGAKKVGKSVKKGAKKVGDAIGGLFKKKKK